MTCTIKLADANVSAVMTLLYADDRALTSAIIAHDTMKIFDTKIVLCAIGCLYRRIKLDRNIETLRENVCISFNFSPCESFNIRSCTSQQLSVASKPKLRERSFCAYATARSSSFETECSFDFPSASNVLVFARL